MRTLNGELAARDNDYTPATRRFATQSGQPWSAAGTGRLVGPPLSAVLPARNVAHAITAVLDGLHAAWASQVVGEVVVVDDASTDATGHLIRQHPLPVTLVTLPTPRGAPVARNLGAAVATGDTILFVDADMVLTGQVIADVRARAADGLVLLGFRHNLTYQPGGDPTRPLLPATPPCLEHDHRVVWHAGPGRMLHTGIVLHRRVEARPLEATDDLRALGHGARYYDWDLPRMVVTATLAVSRAAVIDVGGFHPGFAAGWGAEDTHLGAKLIATGHNVVPVRSAVGYHIDPPDAESVWKDKLARWPRNHARYQRLLAGPLPRDGARWFTQHTNRLLAGCEVTTP